MSALFTALVLAALFGIEAGEAAHSDTARVDARYDGVVDVADVDAGPPSTTGRALAGPPGEACRKGAALCREAYEKLEKCELAHPDAPESCADARAQADARCRDTTSACHTDGSRLPPGR